MLIACERETISEAEEYIRHYRKQSDPPVTAELEWFAEQVFDSYANV